MSDVVQFANLGADDYDRAKRVLNRARHPGFIGRELFYRCATTGVVCIATLDDVDCGVAMIAKGKLQALSIIADVHGKGVGSALMRRLQPQWVSAITERIGFFERLGYKPVGAPKVGQNGKHATQLMQIGEIQSGATSAVEIQPGSLSDRDSTREEVEKQPEPWPVSRVAETARSLAEKARRRHLPQRHEFVAMAFDLMAEAMERVQVFETHEGTKKYPAPQHQAANKALEIAAELALKSERNAELNTNPAELEKLGWQMTERPDGVYELRKLSHELGAPEGERVQ